MTFLYVFRDNPDRKIVTDVEWAIFRYQHRFDKQPSVILVNPEEEKEFVDVGLKIKPDDKIGKGYFGVL